MTASQPVCVGDVRRLAETAVPPEVWDFVEGGSGAELTLASNTPALESVAVVPRVLTGVSTSDTSGTLLGRPVAMPVAVAPMAYQRLLHPDGELAAARAAQDAGVPFILSTLSSCRIEEVTATGGTTWFQLYWLRDEELTSELVRRAERHGCSAIVLTVDAPILGHRLRDVRNGFTLPPGVRAVNLDAPDDEAHVPISGTSAVATHVAAIFCAELSWRHLARLREWTTLPLVVKGILDPRDARHAVDTGADAIVVSNHGGRQLDAAPPSVVALGPVIEEVGGACEVLLDSGVRGGTDVLRAIALGASGVLVGRPVLWGLAAAGEAGVRRVLSLIHAELSEAMTLAGCADLAATGELRTAEVRSCARHG
ncbi:MAG TPA: alpha-hydroxy acid oxidase [Pseudonocardiaceae bacterium]|nr:alpha-hydroxy acid oxidase [Pseudonocardiaceae bacterium]